MKYTGPVAAKLGISLEEAAAMAGMLANNGLRGSDAGTAMRASLSRLASPPKAAADALKELGCQLLTPEAKCARWRMCCLISIRRHKNTDRWTRFPSSRTSPEKRRSLVCRRLLRRLVQESCKTDQRIAGARERPIALQK